ncbi:hypothetical protein CEXT_213201 [Caerostris extrusa]|uniref:Uncharacterized protein n=1 Tax=Caerostris extrusa TaxID=172846 RepID=A0AAV4PYG0_CAEEX|nr:hypothetical protein CEXT_213201 [Caerostris extrusa]
MLKASEESYFNRPCSEKCFRNYFKHDIQTANDRWSRCQFRRAKLARYIIARRRGIKISLSLSQRAGKSGNTMTQFGGEHSTDTNKSTLQIERPLQVNNSTTPKSPLSHPNHTSQKLSNPRTYLAKSYTSSVIIYAIGLTVPENPRQPSKRGSLLRQGGRVAPSPPRVIES